MINSIDNKKIEFHYTKEVMVKELLKLVPYQFNDELLDPGSGMNKVWYNNFQCKIENKYECEIDDGPAGDFFMWNRDVDWVIGNPPYHQSWKFTDHSIKIVRKGIAWLLNNQALNSHWTPARLEKLKNCGFEYTKIHVVADTRWFGRYYFIILEKNKKGILSWTKKVF